MTYAKLILAIIGLVQYLAKTWQDKKMFDAGQSKAIAEALTRASDEIRVAAGIEAAAAAKHNADATDSAFDNEFARKP